MAKCRGLLCWSMETDGYCKFIKSSELLQGLVYSWLDSKQGVIDLLLLGQGNEINLWDVYSLYTLELSSIFCLCQWADNS